MEAFTVDQIGNQVQITFDSQIFKKNDLARLLHRLYIEYLARKIDVSEEVEALGDEIRRNYWSENKARILAKIYDENGSPRHEHSVQSPSVSK